MKWINQFTFGLLVVLWSPFSATWAAPSYSIALEQPNNDVRDLASLQRGAVLFSNYCMACHSAEYMRFNRVARDLGWTDEQVVEKVAHGLNLPVDPMTTRIQPGVSEAVFGIKAPDLSLMARLKGNDYVYTFIRGYYEDEQGNWNNHVLAGTSMPNVLEGLKRHATAEEFDQATVDLVNFLDYLAEPYKVKRWDLGWKAVVFLLILLLFTYLLKREYWRDIKH
jgi:ubiquinol-cytochrome c reductase cytochrome c1 subunit